MRKVLVVFVLAVLLVLAFSVPAMAGAADPPNTWGQFRASVNVEVLHPEGFNYGRDLVPYIKEVAFAPVADGGLGLKNFGQFVEWRKIDLSQP